MKKENQKNQEKQSHQFEVIVNEENQAAKFANSIKIWHTPFEFYLDFGQFIPGTNKIKINSRLVLTPQHVMSLRAALLDNITKYEAHFGKIKNPVSGGTKLPEKEKKEVSKEYTSEYVG